MDGHRFKPGDWVVYRKQKSSSSPGPRARHTTPSTKGESYTYLVDKYWVVDDVQSDGHVDLKTRRGKHHVVPVTDPRLRKAFWWERWMYGQRYRAIVGEA